MILLFTGNNLVLFIDNAKRVYFFPLAMIRRQKRIRRENGCLEQASRRAPGFLKSEFILECISNSSWKYS